VTCRPRRRADGPSGRWVSPRRDRGPVRVGQRHRDGQTAHRIDLRFLRRLASSRVTDVTTSLVVSVGCPVSTGTTLTCTLNEGTARRPVTLCRWFSTVSPIPRPPDRAPSRCRPRRTPPGTKSVTITAANPSRPSRPPPRPRRPAPRSTGPSASPPRPPGISLRGHHHFDGHPPGRLDLRVLRRVREFRFRVMSLSRSLLSCLVVCESKHDSLRRIDINRVTFYPLTVPVIVGAP